MIIDALLEQGLDVPDDLFPVPVWAAAEPYRVAFDVLSASRRQNGFGWDALAYSEIVAYAEVNGYAESIAEREEFVTLVQAQDGAFLECAAKERGKK